MRYSKKGTWASIETLRKGFERFFIEHGHFPNAVEIDDCLYLCSSRQIQRLYGGLPELRKRLGLGIISYGSGENRKKIWKIADEKSLETEQLVKNFLVRHYGEICVHEEIKVGMSRQRLDFFVYAKDNFAVDVFNTYTLRDLVVNINSKLCKYKDYPFRLFFIVTGAKFYQKAIDELMRKKANKLPPNMKSFTFEEFKKECGNLVKPLKMRIKFQSINQLKFI